MKRSNSEGLSKKNTDPLENDSIDDDLNIDLISLTKSPVVPKPQSRMRRKLPKMQNYMDMKDVLPIQPLEKLPTPVVPAVYASYSIDDIAFRINMYLDTQLKQVIFDVTRFIQSSLSNDIELKEIVDNCIKKLNTEIENELKINPINLNKCFRNVLENNELLPFKALMASIHFVETYDDTENKYKTVTKLAKKLNSRYQIFNTYTNELLSVTKELDKTRKALNDSILKQQSLSNERKKAIYLLDSQLTSIAYDLQLVKLKSSKIEYAPKHNVAMIQSKENLELNDIYEVIHQATSHINNLQPIIKERKLESFEDIILSKEVLYEDLLSYYLREHSLSLSDIRY